MIPTRSDTLRVNNLTAVCSRVDCDVAQNVVSISRIIRNALRYGHGVAHLHFGGGNRHTLMNNSSGFAGCINPGRDTCLEPDYLGFNGSKNKYLMCL